MLDATVAPPLELPALATSYDEGSFDKDAQGWCSRNVAISQDGLRVRVRRWGDESGTNAHDELLEGDIDLVLADRGLVTFTGELAGHVFNLTTSRMESRPDVVERTCPACDESGATTSSAPLSIVAAPLFNDSTGGSNWCLKMCSTCHALFDWRHEYTYLVNSASEHDTYVSRLGRAGSVASLPALRTLFATLRKQSRPTDWLPRTARLGEDFGPAPVIPIDQEGAAKRIYPMMKLLQLREPQPAAELLEVMETHARFVAGGGAGGGWRTALAGADQPTSVVLAFYGCPDGASLENQAHLELVSLVAPRGHRLDLPSADLLAVRCVQQDLTNANIAGAMLVLAELSGSVLRGATLARADCSDARLVGCDLRDADLRGTDFERADLTGADFRGARIDGASFLDARTVGIRR